MLCLMSTPFPIDLNDDDKIIDIGPSKPKRRGRRKLIILIVAAIVILVALFRSVSIYLSALWFGSLGYSSVYWYIFRLKLELFLIFFALTAGMLRGAFWLVERAFRSFTVGPRTVFINQQPVKISPGRVLRPLAWIISIVVGLIFGFGMRAQWRDFALYFHQPQTNFADPIFNRPVSFYLFTLPVYDAISSWLLYLSIIVLLSALAY